MLNGPPFPPLLPRLEESKHNYDTAKDRVAKLHKEFDALKKQLADQVNNLQAARGDLISQVAGTHSGLAAVDSDGSSSSSSSPEDDTTFVTHPRVKSLRDAAATLAAAGTSKDAADAATHALSYTQQVASRVGDLADQSEEQAKRIVDAARLAQEAKEAMRAALEQSSKIVDYNTHAAQAVAQDSGFVTTAAQTISGYLHNIFHDSRAVHTAAIAAVKHMNSDVAAADRAVDHIEADANEAYDVLEHINKADSAATGFAHHARAAAITAATAANGALKGERAAMVGGLKAISSAHSAQAGAKAAMEYAKAAAAAVHPYVYKGGEDASAIIAPPDEAAVPMVEAGPGMEADLKGAKELVDSVVVLMQQLTNALEAADDCDKVQEILTYYQAMMARYHAEGQNLAGNLAPEDMNLVEQYAQTQVAAFASDLEGVVKKVSEKCEVPVSDFIPDASKPAEEAGSEPVAPAAAASAPSQSLSSRQEKDDASDGGNAREKIAKLKKQLAWVKRERLLKKESASTSAPASPKAAWDKGSSSGSKAAAQHGAVAKEQAKVNQLKATIAALQQEKAKLTGTL